MSGRSGKSSRRRNGRLATILLGATIAVAPVLAEGVDEGAPRSCSLAPESRELVQSALDDWAYAETELLKLEEEPLAHVVLFDVTCEWHLAAGDVAPEGAVPHSDLLSHRGGPLPVFARPHGGEIALPDGQTIPPRGLAFAGLDEGTGAPFFVLALPGVWREDPKAAAEPALAEILRGVVSHEIVHTRQLRDVARRVEELGTTVDLPPKIHDDMIEERFASNESFARRWQDETDLLFRALGSPDAAERAKLICESLDMARARQREFYEGELDALSALEEIFLNMEGVAVWTAYRLAERRGSGEGMKAFEREGNSWSQDHGFALTMLLDAHVSAWRTRILSEEVASPMELLEDAVCRTVGAPAESFEAGSSSR